MNLNGMEFRSRDFNTISKALDAFWRHDYSHIEDLILELFPNSASSHLAKDVALVSAAAREHAVFYRRLS